MTIVLSFVIILYASYLIKPKQLASIQHALLLPSIPYSSLRDLQLKS